MDRILTAFVMAMIVASCAPIQNAGETASGKSVKAGDIFYASQAAADAAFDAFDRDNPSCQLWTNWQKMCSRTGEGGTTWCTTDPDRPVRPSKPFCAQSQDISFHPIQVDGIIQRKSASRFCQSGSAESCRATSYNPERPFSGKGLASRRHPYCSAWSDLDTGKAICAEDDSHPELARCDDILLKGYRAKRELYCSSENQSIFGSCLESLGFRGAARGESRPKYPYKKSIESNDVIAIASYPNYLLSIYCDRRK